MIDLYNDATGERLGVLTEADLKVLADALEEESSEDRNYYIDAATIDVIADGRATEHLVGLLRRPSGPRMAWIFGGSGGLRNRLSHPCDWFRAIARSDMSLPGVDAELGNSSPPYRQTLSDRS